MNILIILKKEKLEKTVEAKHGLLLEQAKYWVSQGNTVYVFGIKTPDKWKDAGFRFVKSPGSLPNNLRAYFWFLGGNHPRVDLVIESVGLINLLFKKTTTVFYFPGKTSKDNVAAITKLWTNKLTKFIFSKIYKKQHYLFSDLKSLEEYSEIPISAGNTFLLKKGLSENLPKKASRINEGGKTVLFASKSKEVRSYEAATEVFKSIDRKTEDSRLTILANKTLLKKIKDQILKYELTNGVGVWAFESQKILIREILRSDFLIDTEASEESYHTDIEAMQLKTLVVAKKSMILDKYPGMEKVCLIFDNDDPGKIAQEILSIASDPVKKEKMIRDGIAFANNYSWRTLAQESLKFLESI